MQSSALLGLRAGQERGAVFAMLVPRQRRTGLPDHGLPARIQARCWIAPRSGPRGISRVSASDGVGACGAATRTLGS
jgi:hypothetical protein